MARSVLIALFFVLQTATAAIPDFSLTVTKTNETCTGNGSLTFNVSGTAPGATITYSIYLLPNTTTPIAVTSANTVTGLSAGNYRVVATQTLGVENNSKQSDISIANNIVNLV